MPSVTKRKDSWILVAYNGYDEQGKQIKKRKSISAIGVPKKQALRLAAIYEQELLKEGFKKNKEHTLSSFILYWWENFGNEQSPTTISRNKQLLSRIESMLGHIRIKKLEPKHILAMIHRLQQPDARMDGKGALSSRTVSMHFKLLQAILNKAVKWQFIDSNPCLRVDPPKQFTKKTAILQESELAKFLHLLVTTAPAVYKCFFLLAFTDGLRRSEVCGIDKKNIDFEKGTLKIATSAVLVDGQVIYKDQTKTKLSEQVMYIAPITMAAIKELMDEQKNVGVSSTKLFVDPTGKPLNPARFTRWVKKFCKSNDLPQVTAQSFRKMAITYAMQHLNLKEVSVFGRHSDIGTTATYYADVLQSRMKTPTEILNKTIQSAIDSEGTTIN